MILNPFGLAFLQGTLKRSGGDIMWEFTATVTGAAVAALLVAAWIECYIRDRMIKRRGAGTGVPDRPLRADDTQANVSTRHA